MYGLSWFALQDRFSKPGGKPNQAGRGFRGLQETSFSGESVADLTDCAPLQNSKLQYIVFHIFLNPCLKLFFREERRIPYLTEHIYNICTCSKNRYALVNCENSVNISVNKTTWFCLLYKCDILVQITHYQHSKTCFLFTLDFLYNEHTTTQTRLFEFLKPLCNGVSLKRTAALPRIEYTSI